MLVKFNSSTAGQLLMYAENAREILALIDKEALQRGVITLEQLPLAISTLETALAEAKVVERAAEKAAEAAEALNPEPKAKQAPSIGLVQRIPPFLEHLRRTLKEDGYVMWEAAADFK